MNFNNLDLLSAYQEGGNTKIEEQVSGRYVKGVAQPEQHDVNAEVEKNEFIQYPDKEISQVDPKGNSHAQGGEMMKLPPETKILSDNIEIGKEVSSKLGDMFDIPLKSTDTIAKAMEKIRKSIGMEGILIRMEEYLVKIKENNKVKDKDTKRVNEEFLANKIYEIEQERNQKKQLENQIFDFLFNVQETRKQAEEMGHPDHQNIRKRPPLEQPTEEEMAEYEQMKAAKKPKNLARPGQQGPESMQVMVENGGRLIEVFFDGGSPYVGNVNDMQALEIQAMQDDYDTLDEFLYGSYADGGGIPQRYKSKGFTKVGVKKRAPSGAKHKWEVLARKKVGGKTRYKIVKGGFRGMKDFKSHKDPKRKKRFWDRMGGKNSPKAKDPFSPLYWHKRFGTWEEGGETTPPVTKHQVSYMIDPDIAGGGGGTGPRSGGKPSDVAPEANLTNQQKASIINSLRGGSANTGHLFSFFQQGGETASEYAKRMGMDWPEGVKDPVYNAETKMWDFDDGTPSISKGDARQLAIQINQGQPIPDAYKVAENIRNQGGVASTPINPSEEQQAAGSNTGGPTTIYDPQPIDVGGVPHYEVEVDGKTYLLEAGKTSTIQTADGKQYKIDMGDVVSNEFNVDTRQEAGYKTGFSTESDIRPYRGADKSAIDAQTAALDADLAPFFQAIEDGTLQADPETGKFNLPLTVRGGSSSRKMALGQTKRELQYSFDDLIQYYPELEGQVGFIQPDGSIDPMKETNQVALPAGFHNVFGEDFDPSNIQSINLGELSSDDISNIGNDALAYNRNRTEYEDVLLPYLESKGYNIDQFNVSNEMLPYRTAEETAADLGIDYAKIKEGDFSELSERLGREVKSADEAERFLLDAAQFSGIGGQSEGEMTSLVTEITPEELPEPIPQLEKDPAYYGGPLLLSTPRRIGPDPMMVGPFIMPEYDRVSALKVSPQAGYQENTKQLGAGMDIMTQSVGSQVGSNVANIFGQSAENINKLTATTNAQNFQYADSAQRTNAQIDQAEQIARTEALTRFGGESMQAYANTLADRRAYLNTLEEDRRARDREARELNIYDAIYPQYTFDMFGNVLFDPEREGDFYVPSTTLGQQIYASAQGTSGSTEEIDDNFDSRTIDGVRYVRLPDEYQG